MRAMLSCVPRAPVLCGLLCACRLAGADDFLLARIRQKMSEILRHIPDYTCLQTIERWRQGDPGPQNRFWERLRLEVAVIGGRERFAWPGASRFEDKRIDEILPPGTSGTGDFSGFATAIFRSESASFQGPAAETLDGRAAWRYDYQVPVTRSRYTIREGGYSVVAGYHGAFWVDRETLELLRLDVEADGLPHSPLEITSARTAILYQKANIGERAVLLPHVSELSLSAGGARVARNRTTFSRCRQYVGQVTLRFDDADSGATPAAQTTHSAPLPPGLNLELSLETPLDPAQAAAGDPIQAVLVRDVRRGGTVLVNKGARATGRLRAVRQHLAPRAIGVLALEFDRLHAAGLVMPFRARLELLGSLIPGARRQSDVVVSSTDQESAIVFNGPLLRLAKGLRMQWRTIP